MLQKYLLQCFTCLNYRTFCAATFLGGVDIFLGPIVIFLGVDAGVDTCLGAGMFLPSVIIMSGLLQAPQPLGAGNLLSSHEFQSNTELVLLAQ